MAFDDENPMTGYSWNYVIDINHDCGPDGSITMTNDEYVKNQAPQRMMGVGGKRYLTFTVNNSVVLGSECQIGFTYNQSWNMPQNWQESPENVLKIFIV